MIKLRRHSSYTVKHRTAGKNTVIHSYSCTQYSVRVQYTQCCEQFSTSSFQFSTTTFQNIPSSSLCWAGSGSGVESEYFENRISLDPQVLKEETTTKVKEVICSEGRSNNCAGALKLHPTALIRTALQFFDGPRDIMKTLLLSVFFSVTVQSLQLGQPASHHRLSGINSKPSNVVDEPENFLLLGKSNNEFTGERSEKFPRRI